MSRARFLFGTILLLTFWGCNKDKPDESSQSQAQPNQQQAQPPAEAPPPVQRVEPAPAPRSEPKSAPVVTPKQVKKVRPTPLQAAGNQAPASTPVARTETTAAENPRPPLAAAIESTPAPVIPKTAVIPSGTKMRIRLEEAISSEDVNSGDAVKATLDEDVEVDGKVVAPRGSAVVGKVVHAERSGRVEGRAQMSLTLT